MQKMYFEIAFIGPAAIKNDAPNTGNMASQAGQGFVERAKVSEMMRKVVPNAARNNDKL